MERRYKIPDSKYSFEMDSKGLVKFFRYDEDVTDLVGNNLAFDMAYMIESLLKENEQLKEVVKETAVPKETVRLNLEKLYKSKNAGTASKVSLNEEVSLFRKIDVGGWMGSEEYLLFDKKGTVILSDNGTADVLAKEEHTVLLQKETENGELKIFHLSREDFDKASFTIRKNEVDVEETYFSSKEKAHKAYVKMKENCPLQASFVKESEETEEVDTSKSDEFEKMALKMGGKIVKLSPGSKEYLNVFELTNSEEEAIAEIRYAIGDFANLEEDLEKER